MATYLLGPILGFTLRLRGITSLHAGAIAIGNRAIALLGPAGAGKSTTAAAFLGMGYPLLSEDTAPLVDQGDRFLIQPGYPGIRLWPDSVSALYGSAEALPRITPTWDKRYLDLTRKVDQFQKKPLPLAAIYILGERSPDSSAPRVETVPPHEGLISLVTNSYTNYMLDETMRAREFELLGRVVAGVPLRRVTPHTDPARLSALCRAILNDFRSINRAEAQS
ncbi:MAG: hypothetical protein ACREBD_00380 [Blastocatellia bacterium]